jgi:DUF1365 family protein
VYTQKIYDYTSLRADILSFSRVHVVHIVTDNLRRVVVSARILGSRGVPVTFFYVHVTVLRNKFLCNKTNQMH